MAGLAKIKITADDSQARGVLDRTSQSLGRIKTSALDIASGFAMVTTGLTVATAVLDRFLGRARDVEVAAEATRSLGFGVGDAAERLGGFVGTQDLLLARNRSVQLGLNLTAQEFATLAEKAAKAGLVMGQDVNQSINDIILGIGRQSRLILDNLGVIVRVEDAYKNYAKSIGKAASALTDAEKRTAFSKAAIEALDRAANGVGLTITTAAGAWVVFKNRMRDATDEILISISKNRTLKDIIEQLGKELRSVSEGLEMANRVTVFGKQVQQLDNWVKAVENRLKRFKDDAGNRPFANIGGRELNQIINDTERLEDAFKRIGGVINPVNLGTIGGDILETFGFEVEDTEEELKRLGKAVEYVRQKTKELNESRKKGGKLLDPPRAPHDDTAEALARLRAQLAAGAAEAGKKVDLEAARRRVLHQILEAERKIREEVNQTTERNAISLQTLIKHEEAEEKASEALRTTKDKALATLLKERLVLLANAEAQTAFNEVLKKEREARQDVTFAIARQRAEMFEIMADTDEERSSVRLLIAELQAEETFRKNLRSGMDSVAAARLRDIELQKAQGVAAVESAEIQRQAQEKVRAAVVESMRVGQSAANTIIDAQMTMFDFEREQQQARIGFVLDAERNRINTTIKGANDRAKAIAAAEHKAAVATAKSQHEQLVAHKRAEAIKASISAAVEIAESIKAFASGEPIQGFGHAAAAAAFLAAAALAGLTTPPFRAPSPSAPAERLDRDRERGRVEDVRQTVNVFVSPGGIAAAEQTGVVFQEIIAAASALNRGPMATGRDSARMMG